MLNTTGTLESSPGGGGILIKVLYAFRKLFIDKW